MEDDDAKAAILRDIDAEYRGWIELIGHLTPDQQIGEPPGGGWSVRDMVLHVGSWKENAVEVARRLADRAEGDPAQQMTPADVLGLDAGRFDTGFMSAHSDWSMERSLHWFQAVHQALMTALRDLPAERVLRGIGPGSARLWYWSPAVIKSAHHRHEVMERFNVDRASSDLPRGTDSDSS